MTSTQKVPFFLNMLTEPVTFDKLQDYAGFVMKFIKLALKTLEKSFQPPEVRALGACQKENCYEGLHVTFV